ncbi:hypothetical protein BGZ93_010558 [Podila epicladia]|nr:hypothetical protein BGZ93_010558 [Podila epicladia]
MIAKGDAPRAVTGYVVSAYNGKKIVALGSLDDTSTDRVSSNVVVYHIASSSSLKVAETTTRTKRPTGKDRRKNRRKNLQQYFCKNDTTNRHKSLPRVVTRNPTKT